MPKVYTPSEAAQIVGVVPASVRNWCSNPLFARWLSPGATPPAKQARRLNAADLRVLKFIAMAPPGTKLETIAGQIAAGDLQDMDWNPPGEEEPQPAQEQSALVLVPQLQGIVSALAESRTSQERLQQALEECQRERGRLEQEIAQLRAPWWRRLFGP